MTIPSPQNNVGNIFDWLRNIMQQGISVPGGASDPLAQAYLQSQTQAAIAALNQAGQLSTQDMANQIRMMELMGAAAPNQPTDAAARWRAELKAQQDVQDERLRQEEMAMLGYNPAAGTQTTSAERAARAAQAQRWAELTGNAYDPNTGGNLGTTLASQAQQAEIARRQAELMGKDASGSATLEAQRLAQEAAQAQKERDLKLALQSGQLTQQESEFARDYLLKQDESRRQQAALTGYADPTYAGGSGQIGGYGYNDANSFQLALGMAKQAGTYQPQLTEAGRAARAGEAARMAEISGMLEGGGLTEQSRSAREQERNTRAATAAQLLAAPKDVFKAGKYFQEMRASPVPNSLLGGGGSIAGFTSQATRNQGTPGTVGLADLDQVFGQSGAGGGSFNEQWDTGQHGAQQSAMQLQPGEEQMSAAVMRPDGYNAAQRRGASPYIPESTTQNFGPSYAEQALGIRYSPEDLEMRQMIDSPEFGTGRLSGGAEDRYKWGGTTGSGTLFEGQAPDSFSTMLDGANSFGGTTDREKREADASTQTGMSPGGPTGPVVPEPIGMGAGGNFLGRSAPSVTPEQVRDPKVQEFFKQLQGKNRDMKKRAKSGPRDQDALTFEMSMPMTFEGRKERDERGLRGLIEIARQTPGAGRPNGSGTVTPGMQPAGPVAAPLWPTEGGTAMPELQSAQSLGLPSYSPGQTPMSQSAPADPLAAFADTGQLDQKLQGTAEWLRRFGVGGLGAQELEKYSTTDKGVLEGALEALGLDKADFEQAYANTRWGGAGNALNA